MRKPVRNLLILTAIAGSLSLVSCRETKEDEAAPPMQNEMREGEEMNEGTADDVVYSDQTTAEFNDEAIAMTYQHYIDIKTALIETDASLAQEHAKEMVAELESSSPNEDVASAAQEIAATTNVEEQRVAFSELTRAMEAELEGAVASGEIYKQYCPMAFEGKGDYWFSNSQEIRNPYYGDKMLKCGRVEATIN